VCRDAACTPSSCNLVFTTSRGVVAAAAMPPATVAVPFKTSGADEA